MASIISCRSSWSRAALLYGALPTTSPTRWWKPSLKYSAWVWQTALWCRWLSTEAISQWHSRQRCLSAVSPIKPVCSPVSASMPSERSFSIPRCSPEATIPSLSPTLSLRADYRFSRRAVTPTSFRWVRKRPPHDVSTWHSRSIPSARWWACG